MSKNVRSLTLSAVSAALGTVLLYLASLLPTVRLAVLCVTSLSVVIVYIRGGLGWSLGTYAVISALGLLLCPEKGEALLFLLFIGYYPIVKFSAERIHKAPIRWILKLAVFNAALTIMLVFLRRLLPELPNDVTYILLYLLANLAFLVYDFALKEIVLFYLRKIDGRVK